MQPQMPYGPPPGPYNPQPGPNGPNGSGAPYGPLPPGYDQQAAGPAPYSGQPGMPYGQPGQQPYPPLPGQAGAYPGQQPMPQYQMPPGAQHRPGHPAPLPAPPPVKKTPYDFFLSQKHPMNTKGLPLRKKAGLKEKAIWVAGGAVVLMLLIGIVNMMTPQDTTNQDLYAVAQNQQETIRVCNFGLSQARHQVNRNFAINCVTGTTTDQARLLGYLKSHGFKYSSKTLGALANADTSQRIKAAQSESTYDDTFKEVAEKQLTTYGSALEQQLASNELNDAARALLNKALDNNKLLIQQVQTQTTDMTEATD